MKLSIKNTIYQAIINNKWVNVSYINKKGESTDFYIGIKDISILDGKILCDIFNPFKSQNVLKEDYKETFIYFDSIKDASILEQSYYETPNALIKKADKEEELKNFLDVVNFDNNILSYLSDCYRLDNDPYLKDIVMIDGIDIHTLQEKGKYKLDKEQFEEILNKVFKKKVIEAERINRFQVLAINKFSIDYNDKQYVVAYSTLTLNFKNKTLMMSKKTSINKSFLLTEEKRITLGMYLDINMDEFVNNYDEHENEYIQAIADNFHNGEKINTRPTIFFLERNYSKGVDEAFEAIHFMDINSKLSFPLKAFFGRNKSRNNISKDLNVVVFDKNKINIDQMRVVYNSLVNHVTYVKGPPGTGKTETIFNVILSSYVNNKTTLICSNNNHPVNDIVNKMNSSLFRENPYTNDKEKIVFPIIRLGNNKEMKDTIIKLREIVKYIVEKKKINLSEDITENSKNKSLKSFSEIKDLLYLYEERADLNDKINALNKIKTLTNIPKISEKLNEQISNYEDRLKTIKEVNNSDVTKYAISASNDRSFQNYIYYSSLARFKKLLGEKYKDLIDILKIEDLDEGVVKLNKYFKDDNNLKNFLNIFPCVVCTNLSCNKLGSAKSHFDLVIMDEAGQCNIASSLIPIVRGDNLLLVGDTNQLQPVTVIEENVNDDLKNKYSIKDEYDYVHNSILSCMLRKDNNSKNILLSYHYRCGKKIANFVNQRFYEKQLKLLNNKTGDLVYVNVENTFNKDARNSYKEEAIEIVKLLKNNDYKDVAIITPFVNQAALINEYLQRNNIFSIKAGTVHTLQGSEKSVIIMSSALSLKTGKRTMEWLKDNHELINVAVTRAKDKFVFVGDKDAIDMLSKDETTDIKILSDYIYNNGEVVVPKSDAVISFDFSNDSKNEKDFFDTIKPYFNRRGTKFKIERNVPVKTAIKAVHEDDEKIFGKKEFDIVIYGSHGLFNKKYSPIVVFEVDGGEHIGSKLTIKLDRQKEKICKNYGIKLIRIPNSAVKDYESIISLFEFATKDIKTNDESFTQMSLFDE